ncbi:MAG: hypothetical protein IPQ07_25825 [Myxococcales bacterium]|nr:hypothetical protein [Myxococcales bacterium]
MKRSLLVVLAMILASGCLIRTSGRSRGRSCPPAHHWEDGVCVHNGNRDKIRDHRR